MLQTQIGHDDASMQHFAELHRMHQSHAVPTDWVRRDSEPLHMSGYDGLPHGPPRISRSDPDLNLSLESPDSYILQPKIKMPHLLSTYMFTNSHLYILHRTRNIYTRTLHTRPRPSHTSPRRLAHTMPQSNGMHHKALTLESINPAVLNVEYAVRGELALKADKYANQLKDGNGQDLPFDKVNILVRTGGDSSGCLGLTLTDRSSRRTSAIRNSVAWIRNQ